MRCPPVTSGSVVCVSPDSPDSSGSAENQEGRGFCASGGPGLAAPPVVSTVVGVGGASGLGASVSSISFVGSPGSLPSVPINESSGLALERQSLIQRRCSQVVAGLIQQSRRPSTLKAYLSIGTIFLVGVCARGCPLMWCILHVFWIF